MKNKTKESKKQLIFRRIIKIKKKKFIRKIYLKNVQ